MYPLLHKAGFCSAPGSEIRADDGLELRDLYISNAVKCLPPENKPNAAEFAACRSWLEYEWQMLTQVKVVLALGRGAFNSFLRFLKEQGRITRLADYPFAHAAVYEIGQNQWLVACYHTSRYNIQTGRMTAQMFEEVCVQIHGLISPQDQDRRGPA
jgi:uracil-DNA glycosylase family 4